MKDVILKTIKDSIELKKRFFKDNLDSIVQVSHVIADAFNNGKKAFLFGNGGSAADASHIAAEFVNRFKRERPGLPAIALNTDMAVLTAIANDYDYTEVFARQLKSLSGDGDIVIAISTSGSSRNILKALDVAKKKKLISLSFTGEQGTRMALKSTYAFIVPSSDTPRIQEIHITLGHVICQVVEEILFELPRR